MKRIEAIIRPDKVDDVCMALDNAGHPGVTLTQVLGRGNQKGWVNQIRGMIQRVNLLNKIRVEVVVIDGEADQIVRTIREAALTGEVGDGKIYVHDMAAAIRIRTNETGVAAI